MSRLMATINLLYSPGAPGTQQSCVGSCKYRNDPLRSLLSLLRDGETEAQRDSPNVTPSKQTAESGREQGSCWYQGGRGGHASGQIAGGGDLTCPVPPSLPAPAQAQRKLGGDTPGEISPHAEAPTDRRYRDRQIHRDSK